MKNKLIFLLFIVLLSCSTGASDTNNSSSSQNSSNADTNPLVGKWRSTNNAGDDCQQYEFTEELGFILSSYNTSTEVTTVSNTGTYSYTDTNITFIPSGDTETTMAYTIASNVLTLNATYYYQKVE